MIVAKKGTKLTESELSQIKESVLREFKVPLNDSDHAEDKLFFLLKKEDTILAMGALWKVAPVIFNGEEFSFFGVLNVIANVKGKGYGKQIVTEMRKYAATHDVTCLGFCMPKNTGFYEKCGFSIDSTSTPRFVYTKDTKRITNQDGQYIFYWNSSDRFMEKVAANPDLKVSIPTEGLW